MLKPLHHLAAISLLLGAALAQAQAPAPAAKPAETNAKAAAPATQAAVDGKFNPVADPKAVVTAGNARFTVLTPELIRMEWAADGKFEDHASLVFLNRKLPVPKFEQKTEGGALTLKTGALSLSYKGDGKFSSDNLTVTFTLDGKPVTWHPGLADTENLQGTTRTLDGARGGKTQEPMDPGLVSRAGWVVVDDSARPLFDAADFSFPQGDKSPLPWLMARPAGERQDFYFFGYGHQYRQALGDFVKVAGRIPLPPRFAFGAWWSRYWDYSDQELDELVKGFRENDVPLDVLVIDMGWHLSHEQLMARGEKDQSGESLGWSGYTWNPELFPYPAEFLSKVHAEGLKATLNLHPASGVQPFEQAYPEMARAMGVDPATRKAIPFDIVDKKFAINYLNLLHHPLEKQGIDFWWLDYQQKQVTSFPGMKPTWWLNYVHFTDQQREGKRPLLFHRWGGLGNHRYQIGFSGDTVSVWDSLAFQPWFTATAANVGYAYWSHDIGGHMPGAVDPELFTRWVEFGAYSPILRTHTTMNPEAERRVWAYPEPYSGILRSTFQLRYAMQPYLYTEARRTYDTGVAFLRPMYYDWPEAPEAYEFKNQYLFGDQMIVAPVVVAADPASTLATEKVWLPAGEWIEQPTGKHFTGPVTVERSYSIDQVPVFVRAGAIVPNQPPMRYTGEKPVDPLIVNLWPLASGASSSYSVYEDSGAGVDYQRGLFARTPVKATQSGDTLKVEIGPVEGAYPGMLKSRAYELRLPADWPPAAVTVNGAAVKQAAAGAKTGWRYEGNTLTTVVPVATTPTSAKVVIEVRRAAGFTAKRTELDGFAGTISRLRAAYDALRRSKPLSDATNPLIHAMETGDRLSYHPEKVQEEIAAFRAGMPQVVQSVEEATRDYQKRAEGAFQFMKSETWRPAGTDYDSEQKRVVNAVTHALKLVADAAR